MNPLFEATVQATEEAIVNALVAAETMTGVRRSSRDCASSSATAGGAEKNYNKLQ